MSDGQATATKSGAPDPLIGRVISDRFKITSLIARGGMGKVYRAEQAPLGRACAVKVLNPNYNGDADPEFHRRFYREASVSSKICANGASARNWNSYLNKRDRNCTRSRTASLLTASPRAASAGRAVATRARATKK